jgi:hypothetical protein
MIQLNQAHAGLHAAAGINGQVEPGGPGIGQIDGHFGTGTTGEVGSPGLLGQDRGGGLYLAKGGSATLRNTTVSLNQATTGDPNISGTFSQ